MHVNVVVEYFNVKNVFKRYAAHRSGNGKPYEVPRHILSQTVYLLVNKSILRQSKVKLAKYTRYYAKKPKIIMNSNSGANRFFSKSSLTYAPQNATIDIGSK